MRGEWFDCVHLANFKTLPEQALSQFVGTLAD